MKTIREHLESIADKELREAALKNMVNGEQTAIDIDSAIDQGIYWDKTIEGSAFWHHVYDTYAQYKQPTYQQFKHLIR